MIYIAYIENNFTRAQAEIVVSAPSRMRAEDRVERILVNTNRHDWYITEIVGEK